MTALEEYEKERCNDIDNWRYPEFEQGRSYLRDYADAAIDSLKCCGNCGWTSSNGWADECWVDDPCIFTPKPSDPCHFTTSRWQERQP